MSDPTPPAGTPTPRTPGGSKRWQPPAPEELQALLSADYSVEKLLGKGGMGAVYQGRRLSLDRPVAIKILSNDLDAADTSFAERFKNEARAMAKLSHSGIVSVYGFGETDSGLLYIVMEFIEGTDVAHMIAQQGRLRTEHAMAITAHVCDALAYAHESGIIHRDIKPANIMVGYDGVVKVADFGLAKMTTAAGESLGLTQSGMTMGTLHYMAPEALILGTAVDHRADIYAVGVMLYQMLTGKLPQGVVDPPSEQVPGLDPRYDAIIIKAMCEDRDHRYQSVRELRSDLDDTLTKPVVKVEADVAQAPAALTTTARPQRPEGQEDRSPLGKTRVFFSGLPFTAHVGLILGAIVLVLWGTSHLWFGKEPTDASAKTGETAERTLPEDVPTTGTSPTPANPPSNPSATDLNASLISWWKGDGDAKDSVGSNHGILRGNVEFADGLFGKAIRIKDSNSYMEVPDSLSLRVTPSSPLTVTVWTYRTTSTVPFHILGKRLDLTTPHYQLGIDNRFPAIPALNEWTFWTLVNAGGKANVYVNGKLTATRTAFDGDSSAPFEIGAAGNYHGFIGLIDDVRIYNRELPPDQIEALYRQRPSSAASMATPSSSVRSSTVPTQTNPDGNSHPDFTNSLGMKFVPVPDTKVMFCIHETRNKDYAVYAAESPGVDKMWSSYGPRGTDYPVMFVNWEEAQAFCAWLSKKEGRIYRLPTDEEWSYAVGIGQKENRTKNTTLWDLSGKLPDEFPWGGEYPPKTEDKAENYADTVMKERSPTANIIEGYTDGFASTAPVMSFRPNKIGLYDLGGNVHEWCEDWYDYGTVKQAKRVSRGAAENNFSRDHLLSSRRWPMDPTDRAAPYGFRVVVETSPGSVTPTTAPGSQATTVPSTSSTGKQQTWTDNNGKIITAEFVRLEGGNVLLKMSDSMFRVPLDRLSPDSRKQAEQFAQSDPPKTAEALTTQTVDQLPPPMLSPTTTSITSTTNATFTNSLGMQFVPVPGTNVLFCIHETRRQDYAAYAAKASVNEAWKNATFAGFPVGHESSHPVISVNWEDAQRFCAWLSKKEGKTYRLPTDEEWSIAVGLGEMHDKNITPQMLNDKVTTEFPWGEDYPPKTEDKAGNYADSAFHEKTSNSSFLADYTDGFVTTGPVMSFKPNKFGIYDMGGNVWEWCADWWNAEKKDRVVRGSSWFNYQRGYLLSSKRDYITPTARHGSYGFRCVLLVSGG